MEHTLIVNLIQSSEICLDFCCVCALHPIVRFYPKNFPVVKHRKMKIRCDKAMFLSAANCSSKSMFQSVVDQMNECAPKITGGEFAVFSGWLYGFIINLCFVHSTMYIYMSSNTHTHLHLT